MSYIFVNSVLNLKKLNNDYVGIEIDQIKFIVSCIRDHSHLGKTQSYDLTFFHKLIPQDG